MKMAQHKVWANNTVAPKSVHGWVNYFKRARQSQFALGAKLTASQAEENSQRKVPNIQSYPEFKFRKRQDGQKKSRKKNSASRTHYSLCKAAELQQHISKIEV